MLPEGGENFILSEESNWDCFGGESFGKRFILSEGGDCFFRSEDGECLEIPSEEGDVDCFRGGEFGGFERSCLYGLAKTLGLADSIEFESKAEGMTASSESRTCSD